MSKFLKYREIEEDEFNHLKSNGYLETYYWTCYDEKDCFILFSENDIDIALVCCSITIKGEPFIEMIEVFKDYRNKGYFKEIIKMLQTNISNEWYCVPKDESIEIAFKKLGFIPQKYNANILYWHI